MRFAYIKAALGVIAIIGWIQHNAVTCPNTWRQIILALGVQCPEWVLRLNKRKNLGDNFFIIL